MGEYIKDRAIKRGHTTTTVVKRGDNLAYPQYVGP